MSNHLEQFATLFPSESYLQDTLVDLLAKIDGITGVKKLQGPSERGKDLIFYHVGPFGKKRLNACVVKNVAITGNVSSQSGARTVLWQAQQAFDTPYMNGSGDQERVEHVFVISPRVPSTEALPSISGGLESRSNQTTFLCGSELLDLFKSTWPDFLAFRGDFLGRYLNDLRLHLDTNPVMSALILRHSIVEPAARLLTEVYVPQHLLIQLQEFTIKPLSWYEDLFTSKVTLDEAVDAAFNIGILGGILRNAALWSSLDPSQTIMAARCLRELPDAIPRWWEGGFKTLYSQFDRRALKYSPQHAPSRTVAAVQLEPEDTQLVEQYRIALSIAKDCWDKLNRALADHQRRVRQMPQALIQVLLDPEYAKHCALAEAADRCPLGIAKTPWRVTKLMQSGDFRVCAESMLITAPAGFGKTSFCKFHALQDATELLSQSGQILPIYVPLYQLAEKPVHKLGDLFPASNQLVELLSTTQSNPAPFRRVRLYLDGLDEIARPEQRRSIVELALSARSSWPIQVIITAREHVYDQFLGTLPRVRLDSLGDEERKLIISKWLKGDSERIATFNTELSRHKALHDLMAIPLLATLIIGVFRKTNRLPATKVGLYEMCVDLLCGGWDLVKDVQRGGRYGSHVKLTFLKALAGHMHATNLRHAEAADIKVALRLSWSQLEEDPDSFLDEVLQDGLLIRSGLVFLFSHFSFQEYLAAKNLVDPSGKKQAAALRRYLLGDEWWKDVICFYVGLLDNPHLAFQWIQSAGRGMIRSANTGAGSEIKRRTAYLEREAAKIYPMFSPQGVA